MEAKSSRAMAELALKNNARTTRKLVSACSSSYADWLATMPQNTTKTINFFLFPPEIRNMIMSYVLVPGEVEVRKPSTKPRIPVGQTESRAPVAACSYRSKGFQMLATCRQAYAEGVKRYYSENVFYLPPGHYQHSLHFLQTIQRRHRVLIRHLAVRLSLNDISQTMIDLISAKKCRFNYNYHTRAVTL